ncbi:MAG TPA: hypothetical protein VK932_15425 [Kofleriaceae bacterium]|nr:hypothetical protein [Kofleriaceae bacterium]
MTSTARAFVPLSAELAAIRRSWRQVRGGGPDDRVVLVQGRRAGERAAPPPRRARDRGRWLAAALAEFAAGLPVAHVARRSARSLRSPPTARWRAPPPPRAGPRSVQVQQGSAGSPLALRAAALSGPRDLARRFGARRAGVRRAVSSWRSAALGADREIAAPDANRTASDEIPDRPYDIEVREHAVNS